MGHHKRFIIELQSVGLFCGTSGEDFLGAGGVIHNFLNKKSHTSIDLLVWDFLLFNVQSID
ncbi:hypothetical protein CS309_10130 [Lactiplantibacillus plantarum]|nr:hypothetical protein CS309_10130 [Lactiplantibacillus plantarum]